MIAEGVIPQEAFENLQEKHVKIFLTHLKKYVPEDTVA
jgi:hypothetical protein